MISNLMVMTNNYEVVFLKHPVLATYVLQVTIFKTQSIVYCTDGKIPYVRKGAQNLPCDTLEKIRRLELDKGISSFENEVVAESDFSDVDNSAVWEKFKNSIVPDTSTEAWLKKQRLFVDKKLTVAALLLFSDEPQICLPKRSSIKNFRYQTSGEAERDTLVGVPVTVEGCAYSQIYEAVSKTKEIIESIKKFGKEFETVEYPEEIVVDYLLKNDSITNRIGRNITGIKSENSMKRIFWKLRDAGMLYMIGAGSAAAWKKTDDFESKAKTLKVNKNKED